MNPRFNVKIPESLRNDIIDFSLDERNEIYFIVNKANTNLPLRKYCVTDKYPDLKITQEIQEFSRWAYRQIGVEDFIMEHKYGNFIGINFSGGFVHEHKDPRNEKGFIHTRFNFLLQKPEQGGNPVIDGKEYVMEETQAWINLASEWMHGSTEVSGNRARIVLSLGAYIHPGMIQFIKETINNG